LEPLFLLSIQKQCIERKHMAKIYTSFLLFKYFFNLYYI
jgi:hypothetical protein